MNLILSLGEILIRQQSLGNTFFDKNNNRLEIFPGGSEANVAASLAQMGNNVAYCSAFPQNALSDEILNILEDLQVDTTKALRIGDRLGSYILMSANGLSKGEVIYDRKYSSFSQLTVAGMEVDKLVDGVSWRHWRARTPALRQIVAELMLVLRQDGASRSLTVAVDLNYRNR